MFYFGYRYSDCLKDALSLMKDTESYIMGSSERTDLKKMGHSDAKIDNTIEQLLINGVMEKLIHGTDLDTSEDYYTIRATQEGIAFIKGWKSDTQKGST